MGALRKSLFVIWSFIYLIIPITEFAYGVSYSKNGAKCPNVSIIYPCLIGAGVAEGILLFAILIVVCLRYTGSGTTVHTTTTITRYADGSTTTESSSFRCRNLAYAFTVLMVLVSAGFFFVLHYIFEAKGTTQFTDSNAFSYCDQQLFQAAFGLLIASYIVGMGLVIFGVIIYKM